MGDGTTEPRSRPVSVAGIKGAEQIAAGYFHTCVLVQRRLQCWGANHEGQLATEARDQFLRPVALAAVPAALQVAAGHEHTCALLTSKRVRCWGRNEHGQLGTTKGSQHPRVVARLSGVRQITSGAAHTCALLAGGTVRCWGSNRFGQLGDGTRDDRTFPVEVRGLRGVRAVVAGGSDPDEDGHTCAVLVRGSVVCWGRNARGQLGDGTEKDRATPVSVQRLSRVEQVAAGATHTCAIDVLGTVRCWGENSLGQLGDGTLRDRDGPVAVVGWQR